MVTKCKEDKNVKYLSVLMAIIVFIFLVSIMYINAIFNDMAVGIELILFPAIFSSCIGTVFFIDFKYGDCGKEQK